MGQKGAHTCDVIFDNCKVPAANLIVNREGVGFKTAMKVLDKGRLHIAAVAIGASKRMLRDALDYAMNRKQFGSPISDFPLVQGILADCKTELYAAARSEEHTSELQSLMRISYAVFCLTTKKHTSTHSPHRKTLYRTTLTND